MARILIVDDDEDLLHLMGEYLESAGLEYHQAVGAEQARNRLKRFGYDMIVSDFNMPGESGLDLLRYVSSIYPETPFVLWTGCDDQRIKREAIRMGVHAYIQKPFLFECTAANSIKSHAVPRSKGGPCRVVGPQTFVNGIICLLFIHKGKNHKQISGTDRKFSMVFLGC